jgi:hypothetical protein
LKLPRIWFRVLYIAAYAEGTVMLYWATFAQERADVVLVELEVVRLVEDDWITDELVKVENVLLPSCEFVVMVEAVEIEDSSVVATDELVDER